MNKRRQLMALIRRYYILLKRNKREIYFDVVFPLLFVVLLIYEVSIVTDIPRTLKFTFIEYMSLVVSFFVPIMYEPLCISVLNRVVYEKETKMKETLRMTGLTLPMYGFSYIASQLPGAVYISIMFTVGLAISGLVEGGNIIMLLFASVFFGVGMTSYALTWTTIFSDSKLSSQVGSLAILLPVSVSLALVPNYVQATYVFYFLPPIPMIVVTNYCLSTDIANDPMEAYSVLGSVIALILCIPFYFYLYLYLDQVIPNTYGISKSVCFCLRRRERQREYLTDQNFDEEQNSNDPIRLNKLTKKFGDFTAVDSLSLTIKQDEIFALLGHNGAGKTTAIYMLTGVYAPTSGDATSILDMIYNIILVYNSSLKKDLDEVRQKLGLCQQFDVLYELMTPQEHLELVAEMKDLPKERVKQEVDQILSLVMLTEHKDKIAKGLSGGMKRKVSLGMALIGGSQIIILDEPTSGLDVDSRRQVWDLIRKIKQGRSIIMSTQHLDEADELADRICIMSHGKLLTLDTAFNIKKQFGVGYNLLIEPKLALHSDAEGEQILDNVKEEINDILQNRGLVQGTSESSDSSKKKLIYVIPFSEQRQIPDLLHILEQKFSDQIYIDIEMNSLEDAYVNIAKEEEKLFKELVKKERKGGQEEEDEEEEALVTKALDQDIDEQLKQKEARQSSKSITAQFYHTFDGEPSPSFLKQFFGVFLRRGRQFKREPRIWILLSMPFLMALFSFIIMNGMSQTSDDPDTQEIYNIVNSIIFAVWVVIGYATCAGVFVVGLVSDREFKLRSLQKFAGMRTIPYMLGNYALDFLLFMVPTAGFVLLLVILQMDAFIDYIGWIIMLLTCFGLAMIPMTYIFSFAFENNNTAFRYMGLVYLFIGFLIPIIVSSIFYAAEQGSSIIQAISGIMFIDPFYPLYQGLQLIAFKGNGMGEDELNVYFPAFIPYLKYTCPAMLADGLVFFLIACFIDLRLQGRFRVQNGLRNEEARGAVLKADADVAMEAQRVREALMKGGGAYNVKVMNLEKCYENKLQAVSDVTFGIKQNQCLGLLGPNGAGKSTTFNILTLEFGPSFGQVDMLGSSLERFSPEEHGGKMGICAQHNALWDKLTVDEHLEFMGAIKGLSFQDTKRQRDFLKKTLELEEYSDRKSEALSGGNKRKLCCACSLMANPILEFLDEPTTGVDPVARRSLFKILKHLKKSSIMLTTHRMDEAEALCDTIAIMINGKFVCFGSPGHLKQKYGQGYSIQVNVAEGQATDEELDAAIQGQIPNCARDLSIQQDREAVQHQNGVRELVYKLQNLRQGTALLDQSANKQLNDSNNPQSKQMLDELTPIDTKHEANSASTKLSEIFRVLNGLVDASKIHDFSVTRSSLEQVFIHFAKFQRKDEEIKS